MLFTDDVNLSPDIDGRYLEPGCRASVGGFRVLNSRWVPLALVVARLPQARGLLRLPAHWLPSLAWPVRAGHSAQPHTRCKDMPRRWSSSRTDFFSRKFLTVASRSRPAWARPVLGSLPTPGLASAARQVPSLSRPATQSGLHSDPIAATGDGAADLGSSRHQPGAHRQATSERLHSQNQTSRPRPRQPPALASPAVPIGAASQSCMMSGRPTRRQRACSGPMNSFNTAFGRDPGSRPVRRPGTLRSCAARPMLGLEGPDGALCCRAERTVVP